MHATFAFCAASNMLVFEISVAILLYMPLLLDGLAVESIEANYFRAAYVVA